MNRPPKKRAPRPRAAKKLPLSGSEETYTNAVYGSPKGKRNNNCYAWAIGHYRNGGGVKLQPGNLARLTGNMSLKSCKDLKKRALADAKAPGQKSMYVVKPESPCQAGYYKVMAFLAKNTDYHWYRQHKDVMYAVRAGNSLTSIAKKMGVPPRKLTAPGGKTTLSPDNVVHVKNADVWSHKQGFATGPLLEDACGKIIADPRKACRDYGPYNYKTFCGAYCVQAKHPDMQGRWANKAKANANKNNSTKKPNANNSNKKPNTNNATKKPNANKKPNVNKKTNGNKNGTRAAAAA